MRFRLIPVLTAVIFLVLGTRATLCAQKLVPPINESMDVKGNPLLGGWLETKFQQMVQSCTQTNDRLTVEKRGVFSTDVKEVSAIPLTVSRELNLQQPQSLLVQADGNLVREFGYVYTKDETDY